MSRNSASIANSGVDPLDAILGYCGGRLLLNSPTEFGMTAYSGSYVEVATRAVQMPATPCDVTDFLLDIDGTRTANVPLASTLYFAYLSAYGELALSTHAPIYRAASFTQYLSDQDLGPTWRFVGWVRTGAGPTFEDSPTRRCIINNYNRLPLPLFYCPEYVDDNTTTTYDVTSATWAPLDVAAPVITIAGGRMGPIDCELVFSCSAVGAGGAQVSVHAEQPGLTPGSDRRAAVLVPNGVIRASTCRLVAEWEDEAVVEITPEFISAALTTVVADNARNGAVSDPPMTYLAGWVLG
jgi:hypothetical protein